MKANLLAALAIIPATLALQACVGPGAVPPPPSGASPTPLPTPSSRPASVPQSPAATAWIDQPVTPGDWRWSNEGGQSLARFAGGRLVLRCDGASHTVRIERGEAGAPASGATPLTIRTQTVTRTLNAVPQAQALVATLPARDPLLDAMAFSRGRFGVDAPGLPALRVPAWTEVSRVIEDCR